MHLLPYVNSLDVGVDEDDVDAHAQDLGGCCQSCYINLEVTEYYACLSMAFLRLNTAKHFLVPIRTSGTLYARGGITAPVPVS